MNVGFLITAYDQKREVNFTVDMLRRRWKRTINSPISIVISGDPERSVKFPNDPLTRVTTLDDMVGKDFNGLVSTSIMKQMMHGMVELEDLERQRGKRVDYIVHMHGDILLLNEDGFFEELKRFADSGKWLAGDTVGPQNNDYIHFDGLEIMPQLFVAHAQFCRESDFLRQMTVEGELEKKSTEWALRGNFYRSAYARFWAEATEQNLHDSFVHVVCKHRPSQWDLHRHWGGFAHFGNSLHFPQHVREARNEMALRAYGVDLSSW
jgi:hypothetical protein